MVFHRMVEAAGVVAETGTEIIHKQRMMGDHIGMGHNREEVYKRGYAQAREANQGRLLTPELIVSDESVPLC